MPAAYPATFVIQKIALIAETFKETPGLFQSKDHAAGRSGISNDGFVGNHCGAEQIMADRITGTRVYRV